MDFAALARGFALLRMPKMPELRGKTFPDFTETTVDTDTIRYKDKNREKQRQKMLAEQKAKATTDPPRKKFIKNKAWSKQKSKKERKKKNAAKRKRDEVFALKQHGCSVTHLPVNVLELEVCLLPLMFTRSSSVEQISHFSAPHSCVLCSEKEYCIRNQCLTFFFLS